jgi:hypothetical protein
MEPSQESFSGLYQRANDNLNKWFMPQFSEDLASTAKSPTASIGSVRGALGQIPYNCALRDCCDYALTNGQRHLGALARAMDSSAGDAIRDRIQHQQKLILIDLGSGPGLSWLLFAEAQLGQTRPFELAVVNIDHSPNMHVIARKVSDIATSSHPHMQDIDFRFTTDSKFIDSFASSELSTDTAIVLILNHILHQKSETKETVPNFVSQALEEISRLAKRSGTSNIVGISIEPANLNIGFGQRGLIHEIQKYQGSIIAEARISGDRAGKSVTAFRF